MDGEIAALDENSIPRFQLLQHWQKRPAAAVVYFLFPLFSEKFPRYITTKPALVLSLNFECDQAEAAADWAAQGSKGTPPDGCVRRQTRGSETGSFGVTGQLEWRKRTLNRRQAGSALWTTVLDGLNFD
jgi:hypothetical protein